ncbi:MAG: hypothetical protein SCK29_01085 [Bacillota bacterium]|nr:hypothetical protein [Bacillota bacterium]MDW7682694.1 hypothetical protein [Bacillota bacterium]
MSIQKPVTVALLASIWLTGSMIFASGEAVIHYGAFGGILLSVSFLLAFLVLSLLLWRVPGFTNQNRAPFWQKIMLGLIIVMILELLITQGLAAGLIIRSLFAYSLDTSVFIFFTLIFIAILFIKKAGDETLDLLRITKLIALFILAIFLPNYIFLQKGLETVYYNLIHYHPRVLHLEQAGLSPFFVASSIIMFSKLVIYIPLLQRDLAENRKRTLLKLGIAVLSWSSIVIAFATMTIIGITERVRSTHVNELVLILVEKVAPPSIYLAVSVILLFIIMVTFLATLKTALYYWNKVCASKAGRNSRAVFLILLLSVLGSIIAVRLHLSILDVFFWIGIASGPIGIVLIYNLCYNYTGSAAWLFPVISLIGAAGARLAFPALRTTQLVLLSSLSTVIFLLLHFIAGKLSVTLFSHFSEKKSH